MATKGEDPLESRMCTAPSLDLKENKLLLAQPRTNKVVRRLHGLLDFDACVR